MPCGDCVGLLPAGEKNTVSRDGAMKMDSISNPAVCCFVSEENG